MPVVQRFDACEGISGDTGRKWPQLESPDKSKRHVRTRAAFAAIRRTLYWQFAKLSVGVGSGAASGTVIRFIGLQVLAMAATE